MLNEYLLDETLAFYVDLDRLSNTASKQALGLLRKMQLELLGYLSSADLTAQYGGEARIKQQLAEANAVINRYYRQIGEQNQADLTEVSKVTATETAQALATATGQQITAGLLPTNAVLETIANDAFVLGAPLKDWWSKQAVDTSLKYQSAIRQGIVNGETIGQIISRVKQNFEVTDRNAETLVRTSFISVSNTAREQTYQENSDIIKGIEWVAALDFRTCPRCAERDNKRWTLDHKPIDSSIPYESLPLHPNCRCAYIAVTKTPEELGINLGALPERLRASATGMTNEKSFPDWLKRQPKAKIEEQLGKGKAELWLSGKITFEQLFKNGNPLTLAELQAKYIGKQVEKTAKQKFDTSKPWYDWNKNTFDKSPEYLRKAAIKFDEVLEKVEYKGNCAYYKFEGKLLNMADKKDFNLLRDQAVWMHEFGHHIDHIIGESQNHKFISSSEEFKNSLNKETKQIIKTSKLDKKGSAVWSAEREREQEKQLINNEITALNKEQRKNLLSDLFSKSNLILDDAVKFIKSETAFIEEGIGFDSRLSMLAHGINKKDALLIMESFYGDVLDNKITVQKGFVATYSDLIGSASKNKMLGHGYKGLSGHTNAYLKRAGMPEAESFANLISLLGSNNVIWNKILEQLYPETIKILKETLPNE